MKTRSRKKTNTISTDLRHTTTLALSPPFPKNATVRRYKDGKFFGCSQNIGGVLFFSAQINASLAENRSTLLGLYT